MCVDIKIISGDNPVTVSEVARRVGVDRANEYISLDKNGQIVFDRAGFINSDCGKEIRIDLDMCKTDFIKGTDDFKRYKSLGLME